MPNLFELASRHTTMLDEVYRQAAKTTVLESGSQWTRPGTNANEILIPKTDMDGLGEYSLCRRLFQSHMGICEIQL